MGIVQNSFPKLDYTFSNFQGLQVYNFFPKYTFFKTLPSNSKWDKFIEHNNNFNGPAPVINLVKEENQNYFFNHKLIYEEDHPTIIAKRALNSTYKLELASTITTANFEMIEMNKSKLFGRANKLLKKNDINLKSIKYEYKLIPIKYMPKNSILLKLFISGKID
jgi:hypothetical protein